jgi:acyl carrier protein
VFLDALAERRRANGLPALTVDWGAIAGVGYVARTGDLAARMARQGLEGIAPRAACGILGRLIRQGATRAVVSRGRWAGDASRPGPPTEAADQPHSHPGDPPRAPSFETGLLGALGPEAVQHSVALAIARVLETTPDRVDPNRTLTSMGFDSLMAVELQTAIRSQHGVDVSIVDLLERLSPRALSEMVAARRGDGR